MTTQIFPESFDFAGGSSGFTWTLETVPFSSTSRGALLLTGWGSGWSRHRQQKRLEKKPLLRGFLVETAGEEPAGEDNNLDEEMSRRHQGTHDVPDMFHSDLCTETFLIFVS